MTIPPAKSLKAIGRRRPAPLAPPSRDLLLRDMLAQTGRLGVPVRRRFLQTLTPDPNGMSAGPLSKMLRARDSSTLDAFLLIHAMASSSEPYDAFYFSNAWVRLMRFDQGAEPSAASSRWAKTITRLEKLKLVKRERHGNNMHYLLLDESGDGSEYSRPTKLAHGRWFSIPHEYWLDGYDSSLSTPEKVMLLIALDQPDGFNLPYERASRWYGLSASTTKRGLTGLVNRGIISVDSDWVVSGKSPTGWIEVRRYTTLGIWSKSSRDRAMKTRPKKRVPLIFEESGASEKAVTQAETLQSVL